MYMEQMTFIIDTEALGLWLTMWLCKFTKICTIPKYVLYAVHSFIKCELQLILMRNFMILSYIGQVT